ncbi:MAG TPA: phage terminase large subunit family protein [Thermodesulfobacteriota bacterium]
MRPATFGARLARHWAPPPRLSLAEWADRHYVLPEGDAAAGRWRCYPYQRGILDAMSDPTIEQVWVMKSARVGFTKMFVAATCYYIDHDPCPILIVQPAVEDAEGHSKEDLAPVLEAIPSIAAKIREPRAKDSGNTILHKVFPGGSLSLVGANSPRGFRRVSRRVVIFDEVDEYPASSGAQGDPIMLGIRRTQSYWDRKIIGGSTPTVKGHSKIEQLFLAGDQRRRYLPCPSCGHMAPLVFREAEGRGHWLRWPEGRPHEAHFVCRAKGCVIEPRHYPAMDAAGEWRAEAPEHFTPTHRVASFHLWAAYSYLPNATWGHLAAEFVAAQAAGREALQTFVNTVLGETWHDRGEAPEWERLYERRGPYRSGTIPPGGLLLTAGVDVQKDRLVVDVTAWGRGKRSWLVDYVVIPGSVADRSPAGPWVRLDALLARPYRHASGVELPIAVLAIDAGAFTEEVKAWARGHPAVRVLPVKGQAGPGPILGAPTTVDVTIGGRKLKRGMKLWPVYGHTAKVELYGWLRLPGPTDENPEPPPGYCHFPVDLEAAYFKQLTGEQLVPRRNKRGYVVQEWNVIPGRENHALDARVYCRAAAAAAGLDRFTDADWRRLEAAVGITLPPPAPPASPPPPVTPPPPPPARRSLDEVFARARERLRGRR